MFAVMKASHCSAGSFNAPLAETVFPVRSPRKVTRPGAFTLMRPDSSRTVTVEVLVCGNSGQPEEETRLPVTRQVPEAAGVGAGAALDRIGV